MLPVSVWILTMLLKHSDVGSGGRCPKWRKSLSCSHCGSDWKWVTFHLVNLCQTVMANSSACMRVRRAGFTTSELPLAFNN